MSAQVDSDTMRAKIEAELQWRIDEYGVSLRRIAARVGLPASDNALLSKLLRGEPVSTTTLRRLGRALGILPPPRKLIRRTMSPAEAQAWDALPRAERLRRLTA